MALACSHSWGCKPDVGWGCSIHSPLAPSHGCQTALAPHTGLSAGPLGCPHCAGSSPTPRGNDPKDRGRNHRAFTTWAQKSNTITPATFSWTQNSSDSVRAQTTHRGTNRRSVIPEDHPGDCPPHRPSSFLPSSLCFSRVCRLRSQAGLLQAETKMTTNISRTPFLAAPGGKKVPLSQKLW